MTDINIDLTKFKNICGKLIPGNLIELLLVEHYQLHANKECNTLDIVNEKIANALFEGTDKKYSDIMVFYRERTYITHIVRYKSILDHMILKEVSPYIKNIKFNKVVTTDPYVINFKIY